METNADELERKHIPGTGQNLWTDPLSDEQCVDTLVLVFLVLESSGIILLDVIVTWRSDLVVVNSTAEFEKEAELPPIYICTDPYTDCVPMNAIPERIGRSQAKNVKKKKIYICAQLARQK